MLTLEQAQTNYDEKRAAYDAAEKARRDLETEWSEVRADWENRQTTAHTTMMGAYTDSLHAMRDLDVAYANAAAATLKTPITLEELQGKLSRKLLGCRNKAQKAQFIDAICRHLIAAQTANHGVSEESLKSVSVRKDPRRGSGRENLKWLTETQRRHVWNVLSAHCPKRADSGYLAPPYAIYP